MAPRAALTIALAWLVVLSGCTTGQVPTSPTPPATPSADTASTTPSATPTWTAEQSAAIQAVDGYRAAGEQIGSNPAAFSEAQMKALLSKSAGAEVVKANVASYLSLKKSGFHYDGTTTALSTKSTRASDVGYGVEVVVTRCFDQRQVRVLDAAGAEVSEAALGYSVPDYNLRQYTVQKRNGSKSFLIYGLAKAEGACGP